jgi:hypothetical protein
MGMDWHSSGITTSVIGALKRGLAPLGGELGIHVCGGRGKHSRWGMDLRVASALQAPDMSTFAARSIGRDVFVLQLPPGRLGFRCTCGGAGA